MKENYSSSYDNGFRFTLNKENTLYYSLEGKQMRNGTVDFCLNEGLFEVDYDIEVIKKMPTGAVTVFYEFYSEPRGVEFNQN